MKARAFFRSSKLMLPGAVIGASFMSGFAVPLRSWRLAVDDEGNLYQDIQVTAGSMQDRRQLHVVIGQDAVLDLLLRIEDLAIGSIVPPAGVRDDAAIYELAIRYGGIDTWLRVQGADTEAAQGNGQMQRFMAVWHAIHQLAPVR